VADPSCQRSTELSPQMQHRALNAYAGRDPAERAGAVALVAAAGRVRVLAGLGVASFVALPGERPDRGLCGVTAGLEVVTVVAVVLLGRDPVAAVVLLALETLCAWSSTLGKS
jgi:hypothetical protein